MKSVLEVIQSRRSVRRFTGEQISDAELESLIEAGRYAPSGGNSQTNHLIVIQKESVLAEIRSRVQAAFAQMEVQEDTYASIVNSIALSKREGHEYAFFFNAPTLIVLANKKGYANAMADCACVLENMMLAAASLGLGSCWINQLRWLDGNPEINAYMQSLGLAGDETICGAVALGYPAVAPAPPAPRKGNPVTYVR